MLSALASRVRLLRLEAGLIWRNIECRYFASVANRNVAEADKLLFLVGDQFVQANKKGELGFGWHTQAFPGYSIQGSERTSEICWEAPLCYTIYLDGKPLFGMAIEFRGTTLCIRQLQGQPGAKIPEELKRWPALFTKAAKGMVVGESKQFNSLRLYSADQRVFYWFPTNKLSPEEMRSYQQNLRRRYDGTARQEGFKKVNTKYWEWHP